MSKDTDMIFKALTKALVALTEELKAAREERAEDRNYQIVALARKLDGANRRLRRVVTANSPKDVCASNAAKSKGDSMPDTKPLDDLTKEVEETTSVVESAIKLIGDMAQRIRDAGTDPAKLNALAASLDANQQKLAEAIAANTPAE